MVCRACSQRTLTTLLSTLGWSLAAFVLFCIDVFQHVVFFLLPGLQCLLGFGTLPVIMCEINGLSLPFSAFLVQPLASKAKWTTLATLAFAFAVVAIAIIRVSVTTVVVGVEVVSPIATPVIPVGAFVTTTLDVAFAFPFAICAVIAFPVVVLRRLILNSLDI